MIVRLDGSHASWDGEKRQLVVGVSRDDIEEVVQSMDAMLEALRVGDLDWASKECRGCVGGCGEGVRSMTSVLVMLVRRDVMRIKSKLQDVVEVVREIANDYELDDRQRLVLSMEVVEELSFMLRMLR